MSDKESVKDHDKNQQREFIEKCINHPAFRIWIHTKSIYNMPRLLKPSATELRKFTNNLNKHLEVLDSLGHDVMLWRNNFIKIIYSKFDPLTKAKWDESFPDLDLRNIRLVTLLDFLENTCQQYEKENIEPEEEEDTEG